MQRLIQQVYLPLKQRAICIQYGSSVVLSPNDYTLGVAMNVKSGILPINGLRHPPAGETTGWYIWAGEDFSEDPDFFHPLHVRHLREWCPSVLPFLSLAPGWRFLVAGDYVDVWFDETLLAIDRP